MNCYLKSRNFWRRLACDFSMSMGIALFILSPYFLQNITGANSFWAFDIVDRFCIPHLQGVLAFCLLVHTVIVVCRRCEFKPRWLLVLLSALMLVFFVRGLIATSGIFPNDLSNWLYDFLAVHLKVRVGTATLRRLAVFVIFGCGVIVLCRTQFDTNRPFRAYAAFGWSLGFISMIRVVSMMAVDAEFADARQYLSQHSSAHPVSKRVVWVIFDEFDFNRFFRKRNPKLQLPNLDRLQECAVFAEKAVSPAWATGISIPALTSGYYLTDTAPAGAGRLMLKRAGTKDVDWRDASTIFSRLRDEGKNVSILGFAFPYSNIFPYAHPSFSMPVATYGGWWWGMWQALKVVPGFDQLFIRGSALNKEDMYHITRLQVEQMDKHLEDQTTSLAFFHFNFPHLPGGRVHGASLTESARSLPGYDQNALTVDWTVGRIVEKLEKQSRSQDTLLIVSTDHWLRAGSIMWNLPPDQIVREFGGRAEEFHRVPLIIRRIGEKSKHVISKPISTIHTARLIEDFLAGRVTAHADIAAWWLDKPYFEPLIPENYIKKYVGAQ